MAATAPRPALADVVAVARQVFGEVPGIAVEPVDRGISTFVYGVQRGREDFYLRVLPEIGDSFAPEAHVHRLLLRLGARVADIVHCEPVSPRLGLSVMVTAAIPGVPLDHWGFGALPPRSAP